MTGIVVEPAAREEYGSVVRDVSTVGMRKFGARSILATRIPDRVSS